MSLFLLQLIFFLLFLFSDLFISKSVAISNKNEFSRILIKKNCWPEKLLSGFTASVEPEQRIRRFESTSNILWDTPGVIPQDVLKTKFILQFSLCTLRWWMTFQLPLSWMWLTWRRPDSRHLHRLALTTPSLTHLSPQFIPISRLDLLDVLRDEFWFIGWRFYWYSPTSDWTCQQVWAVARARLRSLNVQGQHDLWQTTSLTTTAVLSLTTLTHL